MQIKTDKDLIYLVPLGDMHLGHQNFLQKRFERDLNWCINNENVWVLGMGDYMETGVKDSYGLFTQTEIAQQQKKKVLEYFRPLAEKGRLIGLLLGNHEYRIFSRTGIDIVEDMANDLGVEYFKHAAFFKMNINKKVDYIIFAQHGYSSARTDGGKLNVLVRLQDQAIADIYLLGHSHDQITKPKPIYRLSRKREMHTRYFIMSGSYLEHWGSYAQQRGYPPCEIGSPRIGLHTDQYNITVKV